MATKRKPTAYGRLIHPGGRSIEIQAAHVEWLDWVSEACDRYLGVYKAPTITADDIRQFAGYLRNCTDAQVRGVYDKEKTAGRDHYVALAEIEAERRGLFWL
jgi:hypothetical protein